MSDLHVARDRARGVTPSAITERIDEEIAASVQRYAATGTDLARRLRELDAEWDLERVLQANAATLGLTGVLLSAFVHRRWLWLPGIVTTFLLQHALQGWCPPVPIFRRLGVRTRREIDLEKYALKALRGDFEGVAASPHPRARADRAIQAASD